MTLVEFKEQLNTTVLGKDGLLRFVIGQQEYCAYKKSSYTDIVIIYYRDNYNTAYEGNDPIGFFKRLTIKVDIEAALSSGEETLA